MTGFPMAGTASSAHTGSSIVGQQRGREVGCSQEWNSTGEQAASRRQISSSAGTETVNDVGPAVFGARKAGASMPSTGIRIAEGQPASRPSADETPIRSIHHSQNTSMHELRGAQVAGRRSRFAGIRYAAAGVASISRRGSDRSAANSGRRHARGAPFQSLLYRVLWAGMLVSLHYACTRCAAAHHTV